MRQKNGRGYSPFQPNHPYSREQARFPRLRCPTASSGRHRAHQRRLTPLLEQLALAALFSSTLAFGLRAFGQNVGLPGRLGDAVALPAREGEFDRLGQVKLVADRDKDRLDAVL